MNLRARLTVLVVVTLIVALGGVFLATYNGTGNDVRNQIDRDLRQDATTFDLQGISLDARTPKGTATAVRNYVSLQPSFGGSARLYVVRVRGGPVITNEPELVGLATPFGPKPKPAVRRRRAEQARGLRTARVGYTTHSTYDGSIRLLVSRLHRGGRTVAYVGIGEPLGAVDRARAGVARTFGVVGAIALLFAIVAGYLIARGVSRPLRRIARIASAVDGGDLSHRIRKGGSRDEVRVLADAFDRMLDRLEDAFRRQRGFVSDASHELRTPLTVIRGQLEVLARQPDVSVEDVGRVENLVRREIVRMERLVDELLLLARADEGQLVRAELIVVDPFVSELWDGLSLIADRSFRLGHLPGGVISADPDRIGQVVANLVRNAVEHTDADGLVRLTVRAVAPGELEFAVEDDGVGIPPEHLDRIFDRFHRTDTGRARKQGGAGLGLAIARAVVEAHGGTISAGASPEGGARVAFRLPGWTPGPAAGPASSRSALASGPARLGG
jgi:two-component system, OmpR family, sensor kinase